MGWVPLYILITPDPRSRKNNSKKLRYSIASYVPLTRHWYNTEYLIHLHIPTTSASLPPSIPDNHDITYPLTVHIFPINKL